MKTLIIYDNEGKVIFSNTNENVEYNDFIPSIINVPEGKYVKSMSIENGQYVPVFEDLPIDQYKNLEKKLEEAILELSMMIVMGGAE